MHDGLHVFGRHLCVERALGIDDHDGAERAEAEAPRLDDEHIFDALFFHGLFEMLDDLHGVRGRAARAAADEHLFAIARERRKFFGLFLDDASYVDE